MAASHFTLRGRLGNTGGTLHTPITRAEAKAILSKWIDNAWRKSSKGRRVFFICHAHHAHTYEQLVIETTHSRLRSHKAETERAAAHAKWVTT